MRLRSAVAGAALAWLLAASAVADTEAPEAAGAVATGPWSLPADGECQPSGGLRGWPPGQDAPPVPFEPGQVVDFEKLAQLASYFPPSLWKQRERFFYEGMRLEVGACFADYSPPAFFAAATEKNRGRAALDERGGLTGHRAGLPFPPDSIDPSAERAGLMWAWNVESRYRGGGFRGRFRISDMVGREGRAEPFQGEIFQVQLAQRADLPETDYLEPNARDKLWVAGGVFQLPFSARGYAWRQYRHEQALVEAERSDDLHAYLPEWRRVRRLAASGIEGLFMPSFSVGVVPATTIAGMGAGAGGGAGSAVVPDTITTKRSGFEGLALRPLRYAWKLLGVQDVLAPINAAEPAYPAREDREFGPWGLSFASDRWDLRRALVLQGTAVEVRGAEEVARMIVYADLQTLTPLYYMSYDARDEEIDVGLYVGRWSEGRSDYPEWPGAPERRARVIDSAGAAFANLRDIGGWRRESWEIISVPLPSREVRKIISVGSLTKGR